MYTTQQALCMCFMRAGSTEHTSTHIYTYTKCIYTHDDIHFRRHYKHEVTYLQTNHKSSQYIYKQVTNHHITPCTWCWCRPVISSNVFPVCQAMPVHPQHEHGIIPGCPATGLAPLGDAELYVQPQAALRLCKGLNLHSARMAV